MDETDRAIEEQIAYYRARANEYDDWWERQNRYDAGPAFSAGWAADITDLKVWLASQAPLGNILEVAAGTGNWTKELAQYADHVTAIDAVKELLDISATKVAPQKVDFIVANALSWHPTRVYDASFSAFWLSHIPLHFWSSFWNTMAVSIKPGGRVFFIESAHPDYARVHAPVVVGPPVYPANSPEMGVRQVRELRDGTRYSVDKRYWTPEHLAKDLLSAGWKATVSQTAFAFIYGFATRTD